MTRLFQTIIGDEEDFHITVQKSFRHTKGFEVTIWRRNHGGGNLPTIRDERKAAGLARYLYDTLLPEHVAEQEEQQKLSNEIMAELANRPKPKPPRVKKNAPVLAVFICPGCEEPTEERSDERVYECGECGTTATGSDGRQCDRCHKFTAKISETSCPSCEAPMDDAEIGKAQRATDGTLVLIEPHEEGE